MIVTWDPRRGLSDISEDRVEVIDSDGPLPDAYDVLLDRFTVIIWRFTFLAIRHNTSRAHRVSPHAIEKVQREQPSMLRRVADAPLTYDILLSMISNYTFCL